MSETVKFNGYGMKINNCKFNREDVLENYNYKSEKPQIFCDTNGDFFIVIAKEDSFYEDLDVAVSKEKISNYQNIIERYAEKNSLEICSECYYFVKIWYNGCDMPPLFKAY